MPEGPEVYVTTKDLYKLLVGKTIESINIVGGRYVKHGHPKNWEVLYKMFPLKVIGVYCKGKMMWFEFENCDYFLISRFGMSGYYGIRKLNEKNPPHTAFEINIIGKDYIIYYNDVRRFGTLKITDNIHEDIDALGPYFTGYCPNENMITLEVFTEIIKQQKGYLAKKLMDQKIVSGIGNYILSECLYRSNINPFIECKHLTIELIHILYDNILDVIDKSIRYKGVSLKNYKPLTQGGKSCGEDEEYISTGKNYLKIYKKTFTDKNEKVIVIPKGPHGRAIYCTEIQLNN